MNSAKDLPSEKAKRYDRQLRLWGDHGQAALENARICLITANATGTEVLKNLILPGIGSFTIIDNCAVTCEDLGNNFFMTEDDIGKKRAEVACRLLLELNEEVTGDYLDESVADLLKNSPNIFSKYSVVIVAGLPKSCLLKLSALLWSHNIPLVVCYSYGMIGYLRVVVKDHTVIESHPEHPHPDLRLDQPFTELQLFCESFDLPNMTRKDHSHVPWLVILYQNLKKYGLEHGGTLPQTSSEKKLLKDMIRSGIQSRDDGVPEDEENFEEAIRAVNTALAPSVVPEHIHKILCDPLASNITTESQSFWILVHALKEFVESEGCLPLRGDLPDMTADSNKYITLQNIYRDKAHQHVKDILYRANRIADSLRLPSDTVLEEDAKLFCKNAAFLDVITCRCLTEEYNSAMFNSQCLVERLDCETDDSVYYVLLRAAEEFHAEFARYPGMYTDQVETDVVQLKSIVNKLLSDWSITTQLQEDYIHEFCCYGAAELHSVAAYMGGVAAQETIKLVTRQYTHVRSTYIYNAITHTSVTLDL